MILSDGCDLGMINRYAEEQGLQLNMAYTKQNLLEKNFIFKIQATEPGDKRNIPENDLQYL
jgi:hypothetical protein